VVDLVEPDASLGETVGDGVAGKAGVVPLAAEPLLLGRGDDPPVLDEGSGTVVVEGRDAEDAYRGCPQN
jgi:hypothetical protein